MRQAGMTLLIGLVLALGIAALFRLAGPAFFFEGRAAANAHALIGAVAGGALGFALARLCGGLRGVLLAAVPGLLVMAAMTSHFGLAFPNLPPALDKGFGGLMLWFYGFWMIGGLTGARMNATGRA
jgi:hypothetical protein